MPLFVCDMVSHEQRVLSRVVGAVAGGVLAVVGEGAEMIWSGSVSFWTETAAVWTGALALPVWAVPAGMVAAAV